MSDAPGGQPTATEPKQPLGANYWRLWIASVVSNLGDGLSVVAYPWLASALTRNPVAIAGVAVATRLPWLVVTLPAGVITDRVDRRRLIFAMDALRMVLTTAVAFVVLAGQGSLNDPADIAEGLATAPQNAPLALGLLYAAALALGCAEVLRDNAAQTLMPSLVSRQHLERANGRLWGAEVVMNSFVGPPLAGLLISLAFAVPFFVDAGSFAVAAAMVFMISGDFRAKGAQAHATPDFRRELREGFGWLWHHPFLRSLAIALGILNGLSAASAAAQVLFAQEVLGLGAAGFGALSIAFALGGIAGSVAGEWISKRVGQGNALFLTMAITCVGDVLIAAVPSVPLVAVVFAVGSFIGTVWNVITVAMRQSLIPDRLLGRVNSVYRFFGWGMIPIGALVGGAVVAVVDGFASRELALRMPFALSAAGHLLLLVWALPRLNQARIDAVLADGVRAKEVADAEGADDAASP